MAGEKEVRYIDPTWFQETREGPLLMGTKCAPCDRVFFPKKQVCPECFGEELAAVPLSRQGILHTYATSVMGPKGMDKPYLIGFIDLPEKIKLFSLITGCDLSGETLKVGMNMEMVVEKIKTGEDGNDVLGYKFRPVEKGVTR